MLRAPSSPLFSAASPFAASSSALPLDRRVLNALGRSVMNALDRDFNISPRFEFSDSACAEFSAFLMRSLISASSLL